MKGKMTDNEKNPIVAAIQVAYEMCRPIQAHRGLGALGLVLAGGGSDPAAISALLYGAAASHGPLTLFPSLADEEVKGILIELLTLKGLPAAEQVMRMPRLSISSGVAAAALLLVDVASFVADTMQIGVTAASRYVLAADSAVTFRPKADQAEAETYNGPGADDIIQLYDGLARQCIKSQHPVAAPLGHRALTLLYSLDITMVGFLQAWYEESDNSPLYILADLATAADEAEKQPEVEAEPAH